MNSITKADILSLADQASNFYIDGKVSSLSSAVTSVIGDTQYNQDQLARVVEATNQATWKKLTASACPSSVRFEPAALEDVQATQHEADQGVEKTARVKTRTKPMIKSAAEKDVLAFMDESPIGGYEDMLFGAPVEEDEGIPAFDDSVIAIPLPVQEEEYYPQEDEASWERLAA